MTRKAMLGATILIMAIKSLAFLLPALSILSAAERVSKRACSISQREWAMFWRTLSNSDNERPKATRAEARADINSSDRWAMPTSRMQW